MRIGIDARLINETGVGRYIRNLIRELGSQDEQNEYVVFLRHASYDSFVLPNNRWRKALADVPWHTVSEQFIMPWLLLKEKLDLAHIPYFNVPMFYPGKMVVTIHDLTILHFDTGKATTLPYIFYKLRRLGYRLALEVGLRRATKIIAVSHTTKQELIDHFHLDPNRIVVTYEGVDQKISKSTKNSLVKQPYFLYVGNAYPHKNLETLVTAMRSITNAKLVLVGREDYFYKELRKFVDRQDLRCRVIFFGEAGDEELASLYSHARALVFPSLMEGFGLPALEALALGCPVIASDIPVFHEILGDNATYFDPNDPNDLTEKLFTVKRTKKSVIPDGYSWSKLAAATVAVYESCARV